MHSSLSPKHYPPKQRNSHPLKKPSYKSTASAGNEEKGAGRVIILLDLNVALSIYKSQQRTGAMWIYIEYIYII